MKKIIDVMEDLGWNIQEYNTNDKDYTCLELQTYSDLGEDFNFEIEFKKDDKQDFLNELREYVNYFDVDEHAEQWISIRGTRGVPSSIRALIEDAESIKEMLQELLFEVEKVIK